LGLDKSVLDGESRKKKSVLDGGLGYSKLAVVERRWLL